MAFTAIPAAHGITRYCVSGAIDATTCGTFGTRLYDITAADHPFVPDLTDVPFVSVGGLTLIETLAHTTARLDIRLDTCSPILTAPVPDTAEHRCAHSQLLTPPRQHLRI